MTPLLLALASIPTLTDAQLVARATAPFDKSVKMNTREVLGRWRGRPVLAEFPCSDLCPDYTVRIVHLSAESGPACRAIGGRWVLESVPAGIATVQQRFCVPAPLAAPALTRRSRGS